MGVADMTSTWGLSPLSESAARWATPKRCCSSAMTSPSRWNCVALGQQRVGAHGHLGHCPAASSSRLCRAWAVFIAAGEQHHADAQRLQQRAQ